MVQRLDAAGGTGERALIGDGRTAALVRRDGVIDFACLPRFDSPAVFCAALDGERGGYLSVRPQRARATERRYDGPGAVLATRFEGAGGALRVTDFMPVSDLSPGPEEGAPRVCRLVEGLSGELELEVVFRPTFDFARRPAELSILPRGALARAGGERLELAAPVPLAVEGDLARGRGRVRAGDRLWVTLAHDAPAPTPAEAERALADTRRAWRGWTARCEYAGPRADAVRRSAVTLKLLTFRATGALVAAPTTSFPEWPGGARNWDYRYSWPRDTALAMRALLALGHHEEAMAYWEHVERLGIAEGRPLRTLYAVDGRAAPREEPLEHLSGALSSRPVRVGNGAGDQLQLDVGGHVLDAAELCQARMRTPHADLAPTLRAIADETVRRWREPDQGLWEPRSAPRRHVHSQVMCWVALDRAVRLAGRGVLAGDSARWEAVAAEIRREVLERGFDRAAGAFTSAFGEPALDASVLRMPALGFLEASDPRFAATVERVRARLEVGGLLRRTDAADGLEGPEGAFVAATLWLADAHSAAGRIEAAEEVVERVLRHANDVGLLAEEVEPASGAPLGNHPQALSHLALVHSVLRLEEARAARRGGGAG